MVVFKNFCEAKLMSKIEIRNYFYKTGTTTSSNCGINPVLSIDTILLDLLVAVFITCFVTTKNLLECRKRV